MKETYAVTVEEKRHKYFCDVCGEQFNRETCVDHSCVFCERDLCNKCRGEYDEFGGYDRAYSICSDCRKIKDHYDKLKAPLELQIKKLDDVMKAECKKNNPALRSVVKNGN